MANKAGKLGSVISVINMKGGVGKTTISANLFRELYAKGSKNVLIIDFDPQYNLSQLIITQKEYNHLLLKGKTIGHILSPPPIDSVFSVSTEVSNTNINIDDFLHHFSEPNSGRGTFFSFIPGNFRLAMLNLKEKDTSLSRTRKRFHEFIEQAKKKYHLIVLDCNPSSSFLTRAAIEHSDHLLIPIKADIFSILGVEMLLSFARDLPSAPAFKYSILINEVKGGEVDNVETQLRAHVDFGPNVLVNRIPFSEWLKANKTSGFVGEANKPHYTRERLLGQLRKVVDEFQEKIRM